MSDIEVIEVVEASGNKRRYNNANNKISNAKRKRTTSGLIEKSEIMKGTETEFEGFVIDRTVTPQRKLSVKEVEDSADGNSASQWRKQLESTLLGFVPPPGGANKAKNSRYKKVCFNCDGEHNVFECPLPKNQKRIAIKKRESGDEVRRRQDFYNTRLTNQKENNFKPGQLSGRLRHALGLGDNDIPEHVYRMRRIGFIKGYPPGWLQKAIKSTDLVKIFSSEGDGNNEDNDDPPELDPSKVIWYPGFNGSDATLRDLESFKIPPKNVFCEGYQQELIETHNKLKKAVQKTDKKGKKKGKAQHIKFADKEDDDVIIIREDQPVEGRKFVTPGEEDIVIVLDGNVEETEGETEVPETPKRKQVDMGDSMHQAIGTPVFTNRPITEVASLEAFALGIQPFQPRNDETENTGTFRKLMDSLKSIREGGEVVVVEKSPEPSTSSVMCLSSSSVSSKKSKKKKNKKNKNKKFKNSN